MSSQDISIKVEKNSTLTLLLFNSSYHWLKCVAVGYNIKMKKYRELYTLDPSLRLEVYLSDEESICKQSEKIFESVKSDVFAMRLQQVAWEEFRVVQR